MVFTPSQVVRKATAESERLGAFSGYIFRPKPTQSGMTAQIFGENGQDSDTISALSLNKFLNIQVYVKIYMVKDPIGRLMQDQGKYPVIAEFNGIVNRPTPQKSGMMAQFFAPNGMDANAVVELGKSEYQDSLVFVDIRSNQSIEDLSKIEIENTNYINENYATRITRQQREHYQKREKEYRKMNDKLDMSSFFLRPEVLVAIGEPEEFAKWLEDHRNCAFPLQHSNCMNVGHALLVPQLEGKYNYLPMCKEHGEKLDDSHYFKENSAYYTFKHQLLQKEWILDFFKKKFSIDGNSEPEPNRIIEWAVAHNLNRYMPTDYKPIS